MVLKGAYKVQADGGLHLFFVIFQSIGDFLYCSRVFCSNFMEKSLSFSANGHLKIVMKLSRSVPFLWFILSFSNCASNYTNPDTQVPSNAPKISTFTDPLIQLEQAPKTIEIYLKWAREPVDRARDLRANLAKNRKRLRIQKKSLQALTAAAYAGNPQEWPEDLQIREDQETALREFLQEVEHIGSEMRSTQKRAEFAQQQISLIIEQLPQITEKSVEQLQNYFGVSTQKDKKTKAAMSALRTVSNIAGIAISASSNISKPRASDDNTEVKEPVVNNSEYQEKVREVLDLSTRVTLEGRRALDELQALPREADQISLFFAPEHLNSKPVS